MHLEVSEAEKERLREKARREQREWAARSGPVTVRFDPAPEIARLEGYAQQIEEAILDEVAELRFEKALRLKASLGRLRGRIAHYQGLRAAALRASDEPPSAT